MFRRIAFVTAAAAVLVAGAAFAPVASAGNVAWSVSIGGPGYGVSVGHPGCRGGDRHGFYRPWYRPIASAPIVYPYATYAPAPDLYSSLPPVYRAPVHVWRRSYVPAPVLLPPRVPYGRY
jgi:hypothetical protein